MKALTGILSLLFLSMTAYGFAAGNQPGRSNGIAYPEGWQHWAVIGVSHRTDNKTLRVIVGNTTAVTAARSGKITPWPDGSIIGKVVWKDTQLQDWDEATTPGKFVHAEFMFKDSAKYTKSHGWGWARWVGLDKKPFVKGMNGCISCHMPVEKQDLVFTHPAAFPR